MSGIFKDRKKENGLIRSLNDLAAALGMTNGVSPDDLSEEVLRRTRFDVEMTIRENAPKVLDSQSWEVELWRRRDRVLVRARKDGRGKWIVNADELPRALLRLLKPSPAGARLASRRPWEEWAGIEERIGGIRRLKARRGAIRLMVEIPAWRQEERPEESLSVTLGVFGEPSMGPAPKRRLVAPFSVRDLLDAIEDMRTVVQCRAGIAESRAA